MAAEHAPVPGSSASGAPALDLQTRLLHAGKRPAYAGGTAVNPPLVRASTVLFENTAQQREMRERRAGERIFS